MEAVELIKNSVDALSDKVAEQAEKLSALGDSVSEKIKSDFDKTFAELNSKIAEIKQAQATQTVETNAKDVGDAFSKNFRTNGGKLEINAIKAEDVGGAVYNWGGFDATQSRWTLFDLIPVSYIGQTAINYTKQVAFDNQARPVDESKLKPHSHLTFQKAESTLRTIAHYEMVTRQALATDSELRNIINNELYNGLILATENQIINGTGGVVTDAVSGDTYQEWDGLLTHATDFDDTVAPDDANVIDKLRFAMAQVIKGRGWADGIILNPIDWSKIETAKVNNNGTGQYIVGNPVSGIGKRTLWGLPVVDTWAIDEGSFVVGAFKTACRVFLQNQGVIFIDGYINDQLIKNEMTIVAELMGNVGVKKPLQIIKGNFE